MELLGLQDLSSYFHCDNSSLLLDDTLLDQHQAPPKKTTSPMVVSTAVDSSQEITNNQPATPNASSISSASSEAAAKNEMQLKAAEEEEKDEGCMKRQGEEDGDVEPKTKKKYRTSFFLSLEAEVLAFFLNLKGHRIYRFIANLLVRSGDSQHVDFCAFMRVTLCFEINFVQIKLMDN